MKAIARTFLMLIWLVAPRPAIAQLTTGTITGTVQDATGAVS